MTKVALATLMYGDRESYRLELFGSALSALTMTNESLDIYVYSDRALPDLPLPVRVVALSPEKWSEWTQNGKLTHLVKSQMMVELLRTLNQPVLYFDTDAIFLVPPEVLFRQIDEQHTILHERECLLSDNGLWSELLDKITRGEIAVDGISESCWTYNTGIMGLHPAHLPLLARSVAMAHEIVKHSSVFDAEQVCTSAVLGGRTAVLTCRQEILHYWGWRRRFVHLELEGLRRSWLAGQQDQHRLQSAFRGLAHPPKLHLQDRVHATLWKWWNAYDGDHHFAYLSFLTANRHLGSDRRLVDAWMNTCIDSVTAAQKKAATRVNRRSRLDYLERIDPTLLASLEAETQKRISKLLQSLGVSVADSAPHKRRPETEDRREDVAL